MNIDSPKHLLGEQSLDTLPPGYHLPITEKVLKKFGIKPENAAWKYVHDNAMKPEIGDDCNVLIDLGCKTLNDGEMYLLEIANRMLIRRVQILLYKIVLVSANPEYLNIEIEGNDLSRLKVIGRIRFISNMKPLEDNPVELFLEYALQDKEPKEGK